MPAIAVNFDRLTCTFTRCTAILSIRLWGASACRILTFVLIVVGHLILLDYFDLIERAVRVAQVNTCHPLNRRRFIDLYPDRQTL
jgi:hypothetical protein